MSHRFGPQPQMLDKVASLQVELLLGLDGVLRINVDGVCALRVRFDTGSTFVCDQHTYDELDVLPDE